MRTFFNGKCLIFKRMRNFNWVSRCVTFKCTCITRWKWNLTSWMSAWEGRVFRSRLCIVFFLFLNAWYFFLVPGVIHDVFQGSLKIYTKKIPAQVWTLYIHVVTMVTHVIGWWYHGGHHRIQRWVIIWCHVTSVNVDHFKLACTYYSRSHAFWVLWTVFAVILVFLATYRNPDTLHTAEFSLSIVWVSHVTCSLWREIYWGGLCILGC